MIRDGIAAVVAALLAVAFLGFMAYKVGSIALAIIVVGVLAMMLVDFVQSVHKGGST